MTVDVQGRSVPLAGVWAADLTTHTDPRGGFVEWFRASRLSGGTGVEFTVAQANASISKRGVIRGVHYFADGAGQAKYVTCAHGEVVDVAVDLRVGSPTFGRWTANRLSQAEPRSVYLPRGIGHAFVALTERAVMQYLCDREYVPGLELTIHPLDPELALPWPADLPRIVSDRDSSAPTLREAAELGLLPRYEG
ncbi:dTDP-4-dehydrorhamnose 3,5-epimerase family protein [Actinokineospora bangkokensis]|uniref:dTDP-4-dehydrorhamnose 3,5-epimerase n=1 Tax=Actinokineospora bangkokensis TaxID=1193682 RepID=A0A1Q9LTD8_9PSEU|nr:dTDP-4-dehydrorhamnose 3,5-epimerase [Actinokineospora bangkokensis]OLR95307.1 dTDP-4-dehydrorhamnose 3,5-epimerase [Actinokineospora bangkokensis]